MQSNDTICATATATGGAIAIVRVSGPEAIGITDRIFSKELAAVPAYTLHFGEIRDGAELVDEVLVSVFRAPHSYTGEDGVEISCHGSAYIARRIVQALIKNGARQAEPGEFTKRAFLNGKMDLSQAEAVADLLASQSAAAHRIALGQLRGGISKELAGLRAQLLDLTSLLELELDFTDQDVEFADRSRLLALCTEIEQHIRRLTASFQTGNALKNGVPVAIVGAPNVGKSTLLNALLRDDRAIVSDVQGTTRDVIEDVMTIQGILFRFIDTAGIRQTTDKIEQMGIERSQRAARKARIIIMMSEPGVPEPALEVSPDQTVIHIKNKTPEFQAINGIGLQQLEQQLVEAIPQVSETETTVTNLRHYEALMKAGEDIQQVRRGLEEGQFIDLLSEDLRQCLSHLSEIVGGEIVADEVLGNIFRKFCIGK